LERGAGTSFQGVPRTAQTGYSEPCTKGRSLSFKRGSNLRLPALDSHPGNLLLARRASHRGCSHSAALSRRPAPEDSRTSGPIAPDADPIHSSAGITVCALFLLLFSPDARFAISACHRIGDPRWIVGIYPRCWLDEHVCCCCRHRYFESLPLGVDGGVVGDLESDSGLFRYSEDYGKPLEDSSAGRNFRSAGWGRNRRSHRHLPRSTSDGINVRYRTFGYRRANGAALCVRSRSRCEHFFQSSEDSDPLINGCAACISPFLLIRDGPES